MAQAQLPAQPEPEEAAAAVAESALQPSEFDAAPAAPVTATDTATDTVTATATDTDAHTAPDPDQAFSESFFSDLIDLEPAEHWDLHIPTVMSSGARRAMYTSLTIFAVSLVGMLGYVGYHRLVMPVPIELSEAAMLPPAIPQPIVPPAPPSGSVMSSVLEQQRAKQGVQEPAMMVAAAPPILDADEDEQAEPPEVAEVADGVEPSTAAADETAAAVLVEAPSAQDTLVEAAPSNVIPNDSGFASMMKSASTLLRRGRNKEALEAYHRALSHWPDAPQALSGIAFVHLNMGDNTKARQHAARAVEIDPTNSEGWIVLGAALEATRDRPGALAAYKKCATLGAGQYVTECRRLAR